MRLIDADKVSAEIEKLLYPVPGYDEADYNVGVNDALNEIEDAETVDAVPVMRCKDCRHFKAFASNDGVWEWHECDSPHGMRSLVFGRGFCSNPEKKEDT